MPISPPRLQAVVVPPGTSDELEVDMPTSAPPRTAYAVLDQLIEQALADLRIARVASGRASSQQNVTQLERAEEHLNALLDYRHAVMHREIAG
jgi:hypothetical protein